MSTANDNPDMIPDDIVRRVWGIRYQFEMRQMAVSADDQDADDIGMHPIGSDEWNDFEDYQWEKLKVAEGAEIRKALLAIVTGKPR